MVQRLVTCIGSKKEQYMVLRLDAMISRLNSKKILSYKYGDVRKAKIKRIEN